MKNSALWIVLCLAGLMLTGCGVSQKPTGPLFVVNFQEETTLRYKLVSQRDVLIDLQGSKTGGKPQRMTEDLELVMAYTPVQVDPFGETKVRATCESVKVKRSSFTRKRSAKDAVENLAGKSFMLILSPTGQIQDYSELDALVKQIGESAFDSSSQRGRVKDPDMIYDFIALQWYLWEPITSIDDPFHMKIGKTWQTKQMIPFPFPLAKPPARDTEFTLVELIAPAGSVELAEQAKPDPSAELVQTPEKARITSTYTLSETGMENIPYPYEGNFQMRGLFGFLRNYQFATIDGSGELVFNLESGRVESDTQQYDMQVKAAFILPLGDSVPVLKVNQKIAVELLDE